ncbi:hypothetical protein [Streptosporangium sp. NPDC006007]|uniref:hypothetical protein n=1 Tax=Streptosporangium sp. NPDC006007 TaxID=3154575 RepID=UPI0033B95D89
MTPPLLGQRSRGELIAELYDRHAAGLFAYCHDQLGASGAASAVLSAVLSDVPDVEPPRAALYAFARREIQQQDVVYIPPTPGADPISAFVERVVRDLRPHQREVLYLTGVCEMDATELSWVLDVAADTADELTVSACRRFAQSLKLALASARVPDHLADVFGALSVAPIRDVLVRAPWAVPSPALRTALLGAHHSTAPASLSPSSRPTRITRPARITQPVSLTALKPLWPTSPAWPLPLAETDALTSTSVFSPPDPPPSHPSPEFFSAPPSPRDAFPAFPASPDRFPDPFSPPDPEVVSAHEAVTEPMPKLKDSVLNALDGVAPRLPRRKLQRPKPRGALPLSAPVPADLLDEAPHARAGLPGEAPRTSTPPLGEASGTPAESPGTPSRSTASPPDETPRAPADALDAASAAQEPFQPFVPAARTRADKLVAAAPRDDEAPGESREASHEAEPHGESHRESHGEAALAGWPLPAEELEIPAPGHQEAQASRPFLSDWPLRADELDVPVPGDRARHAKRPGAGHWAPPDVPGTDRATLTERPGLHRASHPTRAAGAREVEPDDTWAGGAPEEPAGTPETTVTSLRPARMSRRAHHKRRPKRQRPDGRSTQDRQQHDWAWELFGFIVCVICVAIAMLVFFAVPTIVTP